MDKTSETTSSKHGHYFQSHEAKANLNKKAIKGGGIVVFSKTITYSARVVGTVVLSRILTPDDFGLIAMVTSLVGFFLIFQDMGLSDATVQRKEITEEQISTLFWINCLFGVGLSLIISGLSPVIAFFYKEPRLTYVTILYSTNFIFLGLSIQHQALLKRSMSFFKIAIAEFTAEVLSSCIAILLSLLDFGYWAIVLRQILWSFIFIIGIWIGCKWKPGKPVWKSGVRSFLVFGANTSGFFFMSTIVKNVDKILIGWRYGTHGLGIYSKAYHLFILPVNQLLIPLQNVAVVTLSKLQDDPPRFIKYYLNSLEMICFCVLPALLFVSVTSHDIILILLGKQWIETAPILSILAIGASMQILYATQGWLCISLGRPDKWFRWGIFGSIVIVISFVIGFFFGTKGVAAGYTIALFFLTIPGLLYAGKDIGLKFSHLMKTIWRYFLSAGATTVLVWYLQAKILSTYNSLARLFIAFSSFVVVYLVLLVIFFMGFYPIKNFMSVMKKMVSKK